MESLLIYYLLQLVDGLSHFGNFMHLVNWFPVLHVVVLFIFGLGWRSSRMGVKVISSDLIVHMIWIVSIIIGWVECIRLPVRIVLVLLIVLILLHG